MAKLHFMAACAVALFSIAAVAESATAALPKTDVAPDAELKFVVYFSRHGVRSPTGKPSQYDKFSSGAWPTWEVAPGILTPHGYHLMELFGSYGRAQLAKQGLLQPQGCADADKVSFYADSDQRTQETGKALAAGLFPGCKIVVPSLPEGTNDPLFHLPPSAIADADAELATAAIAGRIGGSPDHLTEAYRDQLSAFDHLLATCGKSSPNAAQRTSLFDIPVSLAPGQGDHLAEMRGPLNTASTLAENLLLEYTEGMDAAKVGWGCGDEATIKTLIALHTAATDFTQRTPAVATRQAARLLDTIHTALEQAVTHRTVPGAPGKSADRALFLIGHDTNLLNMAGALNLTWIADGRRDDTPPGSTLIFELWKNRSTGTYAVKMYFEAQTLGQMRNSTTLTLNRPPERVPVFLPGCSGTDFSCKWEDFSKAMGRAISVR